MKQYVYLEIDVKNPLPHLAEMIAGRAYTIDGVTNAQVAQRKALSVDELRELGFSMEEISLGAGEVVRG